MILFLLDTRFHFRDIFWSFEVFWHGTADLRNSRADLLPDIIVCFTCLILTLDSFTLDLCFCLGRSEEICGKFLTSHMIEDFLCRFQFFLCMDFSCSSSSIESHISKIRELTIIPYSCLFRGTCETLIMFSEFFTKIDSLLIFYEIIWNLLSMGLYSEICLSFCNLDFSGITILCNQIASISRKVISRKCSLSSWTYLDHLGDVGEMVFRLLFAIFTGFFRFFDDIFEIPKISIPKYLCELTSRPIFLIIFIDVANTVKKWRSHTREIITLILYPEYSSHQEKNPALARFSNYLIYSHYGTYRASDNLTLWFFLMNAMEVYDQLPSLRENSAYL